MTLFKSFQVCITHLRVMWMWALTVRAIHNRSHFMVVQKFWQLYICELRRRLPKENLSLSPLNKKSHHRVRNGQKPLWYLFTLLALGITTSLSCKCSWETII